MREIPEDVRLAADTALLQANVKAHMLGEPTDPLECICMAILTDRDRCLDAVRPLLTAMLAAGRCSPNDARGILNAVEGADLKVMDPNDPLQ